MPAANLLARPDTFLGACEGAGQDLGIRPDLIRVVLAAGLLVAPLWSLAAYAGLVILVSITRLAFPVRIDRVATSEPPTAANDHGTRLAAAA